MPLLFILYIVAKEKPGTTCWVLPGFYLDGFFGWHGLSFIYKHKQAAKWADVCARVHLSCEKLSRKSVAALGWRANTVRPYILYMARLAFFDALSPLAEEAFCYLESSTLPSSSWRKPSP